MAEAEARGEELRPATLEEVEAAERVADQARAAEEAKRSAALAAAATARVDARLAGLRSDREAWEASEKVRADAEAADAAQAEAWASGVLGLWREPGAHVDPPAADRQLIAALTAAGTDEALALACALTEVAPVAARGIAPDAVALLRGLIGGGGGEPGFALGGQAQFLGEGFGQGEALEPSDLTGAAGGEDAEADLGRDVTDELA